MLAEAGRGEEIIGDRELEDDVINVLGDVVIIELKDVVIIELKAVVFEFRDDVIIELREFVDVVDIGTGGLEAKVLKFKILVISIEKMQYFLKVQSINQYLCLNSSSPTFLQ